jgi:hypothetical protein
MNKAEAHFCRILRLILWVVLSAALFSIPTEAQDEALPSAQAPTTTQEPTKPVPPPESPQQPSDNEVKITPRQAEELFHSVDEIMQFDSKQTGLRIKREVKRKLTSRDEVYSYLTQHLNDEDAQRLRRSELVLKKFGLLPRDFNLETFPRCSPERGSRRLLRPQNQNSQPARLGPDRRTGAGDGPRAYPRSAGPGHQPAKVDEEGR